MLLSEWARQWGVNDEAVRDLQRRMTSPPVTGPTPTSTTPGSEAGNSNIVRLEASQKGGRLWRNNVGAGLLESGSYVRWGLCNDSSALNKEVKSSDLIGLRPVLIQPSHVGHTFGLFVAREMKRTGWVYRGSPEEKAQLKYLEIVAGLGGDACFCVGAGTL